LLLLITARPEFRPNWAIRSHHATISLGSFYSVLLLGYPEAARKDADDAVKQASDIGQAATSMYALVITMAPI
jgi:hypothetical protein